MVIVRGAVECPACQRLASVLSFRIITIILGSKIIVYLNILVSQFCKCQSPCVNCVWLWNMVSLACGMLRDPAGLYYPMGGEV
jgi:hypothetical protein